MRLRAEIALVDAPVWLYLRFQLSRRDVEDLLAERGLDVTYKTISRWVTKFGTAYAKGLEEG